MPYCKDPDKNNHKTLLIGAFEPEIALLRDFLGAQTQVSNRLPEAWHIDLCGVGSLGAALALDKILRDYPGVIDEIIFFGSAGAYSLDSERIGQMHLVQSFHQQDITVLEKRAHIPEIMLHQIETSQGHLAQKLNTQGEFMCNSICNSTNSITLQLDSLILEPKESDPKETMLENLEVFGLAWVAKEWQLPFSALLAITNLVGPDGSGQWQKNHMNMAKSLNQKFLAIHTNLNY